MLSHAAGGGELSTPAAKAQLAKEGILVMEISKSEIPLDFFLNPSH